MGVLIDALEGTSSSGATPAPRLDRRDTVKKQVRIMKLNRETVRSLTITTLSAAVAGFVQSEGCSKNNHSCVASCSDVPCA
jgi:hypothetical protein